MARPLTRNQTLENTAFLRVLRRTGNVRLAARTVGVTHTTLQHRRKHHPAFAARWATAVAVAEARLNGIGPSGPKAASTDGAPGCHPRTAHRTRGGETVVVRRNDGKLQIRAAQPGKLTRACEQAFLAALSATANVRLSAAAAGASVAAFYRRRRKNPAFAREFRLALGHGYDTVECALMESFRPDSHADDAWRHNEPPAMPSMTVDQGLQLLHHHQKEARLLAEPPHLKRRRGESTEAWRYRMAEMYREGQRRAAEQGAVALAARGEGKASAHEPPAPVLPALDQVTGWSKAKSTRP